MPNPLPPNTFQIDPNSQRRWLENYILRRAEAPPAPQPPVYRVQPVDHIYTPATMNCKITARHGAVHCEEHPGATHQFSTVVLQHLQCAERAGVPPVIPQKIFQDINSDYEAYVCVCGKVIWTLAVPL